MGEFEQAKPIIERLKQSNNEIQIVCSFYSPSGYNTQKHYEYADVICYMPFDTYNNAKRFIKAINPKIVIFIRYELWLNHLYILKKLNIPTLLVNATYPASFNTTRRIKKSILK
jgi:3-deoxy-D-manno-octulosonic-acid transferase